MDRAWAVYESRPCVSVWLCECELHICGDCVCCFGECESARCELCASGCESVNCIRHGLHMWLSESGLCVDDLPLDEVGMDLLPACGPLAYLQ